MTEKDIPIFNAEKFSFVFSHYKYPFIFGGIGVLLFLSAIVLLLKNQAEKGEVQFVLNNESSASSEIKVDIQGAVMMPGVYNLKNGSRINDALSVAGGLAADADREYLAKYLNRAAKINDGQKIYIPFAGEIAGVQSSTSLINLSGLSQGQGKINLNTASQKELESLSGIGPVTAAKIISNRPYQTVEDLLNKKIVGKTVFEKIKDLLIVF